MSHYKLNFINCPKEHEPVCLSFDEFDQSQLIEEQSDEDAYGKQLFYCEQHNKKFESYCSKCKKNLCEACVSSYNNICEENKKKAHTEVSFDDVEPQVENVQTFEKNVNELKEIVDNFCKGINKIIEIFEKTKVDVKAFL